MQNTIQANTEAVLQKDEIASSHLSRLFSMSYTPNRYDIRTFKTMMQFIENGVAAYENDKNVFKNFKRIAIQNAFAAYGLSHEKKNIPEFCTRVLLAGDYKTFRVFGAMAEIKGEPDYRAASALIHMRWMRNDKQRLSYIGHNLRRCNKPFEEPTSFVWWSVLLSRLVSTYTEIQEPVPVDLALAAYSEEVVEEIASIDVSNIVWENTEGSSLRYILPQMISTVRSFFIDCGVLPEMPTINDEFPSQQLRSLVMQARLFVLEYAAENAAKSNNYIQQQLAAKWNVLEPYMRVVRDLSTDRSAALVSRIKQIPSMDQKKIDRFNRAWLDLVWLGRYTNYSKLLDMKLTVNTFPTVLPTEQNLRDLRDHKVVPSTHCCYRTPVPLDMCFGATRIDIMRQLMQSEAILRSIGLLRHERGYTGEYPDSRTLRAVVETELEYVLDDIF